MRKLFLLTSMLFAAAASLFADDDSDKYWLIKDGKFVNENVTVEPYTGRRALKDVPNQMADTVVNGEDMVVYRQISYNYLDVKLRIDSLNPIDRSKYQVLVLEYQIPEESSKANLTPVQKKPLFIIGLDESYETIEESPDVNKTAARVQFSAKWGPVNQWVTEKQFVFMNPSIKTIGGIVFSYAREIFASKQLIHDFPYIKNFYFEPYEYGSPIYAENFEGPSLGNLWDETQLLGKNVNNDNFHGGISPVVTGKDTLQYLNNLSVVLFRDYQADSTLETATDGSKYYDTEILQGLEIEANRDSVVFPGIQLPENCQKVYSQMIIKKHKNENGHWVDASYNTVKGKDMPIKLRFNTGEVIDLAKDEMNIIWTEFMGEVEVPAGATSCDLVFCSMPVGYTVDNIVLFTKNTNGLNDYLINSFDIDAYVDANGNIIVLNGELIATYNMKGQIASKDDNTVIIVVKNEEGAISTKVMIKK